MLINFCCIEFREGSKEEILPDFMPDFPYISSYMEFDRQKAGRFVPWHWHKEVELFYVESGVVEYYIPKGKAVFPAGSGGLVNSNVLHMTKSKDRAANTVQLNHIFDVSLLAVIMEAGLSRNTSFPLPPHHRLESSAWIQNSRTRTPSSRISGNPSRYPPMDMPMR